VQNTSEALEVDDPGSRDLEARFEAFFATQGRKLVGMAYLLTGDLAEAQDLAQETLVRVWERWDRVSRYDKPEAFARRVLRNLVIGRWRRRRAAPLEGPLRHMPAPDVDHLDVVKALGNLPLEQRSAIVMHDVVGLSADEIGYEVGHGALPLPLEVVSTQALSPAA
jgi:RNA polymerase sigma-70 factor (ECF subfamily)